MARAEQASALLAVTIRNLQVLLAIHAHPFVALVAAARVGGHLLAILATLLPYQTLLYRPYALNE